MALLAQKLIYTINNFVFGSLRTAIVSNLFRKNIGKKSVISVYLGKEKHVKILQNLKCAKINNKYQVLFQIAKTNTCKNA